MFARRHLLVLGGFVAALAIAGAAEASWATSGSGAGYSKASSLPAGSVPSHTISTYPNVALNWTALSVAGAPVSYTVRRYSEAGTLQSIGASCSGSVATNACTESAVPVGRWQYTTQATKGGWLGAESAKSTTVEVAAPPTTLTCTNCHTYSGTGTVYVNSANRTAVQLQATLPATSLATDTANLSLTDSASHTVSTSKPATAGAGTVVFSTLSTATFVDGAVTAGSYVTANTGDLSSTKSLALVRDTVAPTASDIVAANSGTRRIIDNGDTITYTFSEAVDPGTVKSGWAGTSTAVSVAFTNVGANDTFVVSGTNLGTVNTTANYVTGAVTCSGSTMVASGATITVTLGTCLGLTRNGPNAGDNFQWTPTATITDLAGNALSPSTVTGSTGTF
ncbi:MAG TPA: hypothetical protein VLK36_05155 [Gaiellaceae bacterium]|nr:hypothetical protein [Gaiellaceae bacterium]